uniref:Uncharacterized protein n=1 Tax=Anopheles epiroticus TaxID=199890 RepID=A0A182P2E9_9DIPT
MGRADVRVDVRTGPQTIDGSLNVPMWPTRALDTRLVGLVLTVVVLVASVMSTLVAAAIRATAPMSDGGGSGSTGGTKSIQILTAGGPWLSIGEVSWPQLELISLRFAHRRTDHYDQHDEHG